MRVNAENKSMDIEPREINYVMDALLSNYLFINKNEMPETIIFPMYKFAKTRRGDIPIQFVPDMSEIAQDIVEDGKDVAEVTPAEEAVLDEKDEEIKRLKEEVEDLTKELPHAAKAVADEEIDKGDAVVLKPKLTQTEGGGEERGGTAEPESDQMEDGTSEAEGEDAPVVPAPEDLLRQEQEAEGEPEPESPARAAFAEPEIIIATPFKVDPDPAHQPPPDRKPIQPPGGDIGPGQGPSDMGPRDSRDQIRTARDLLEEPSIDKTEEKEFEKEVSRGKDGKPVVEDKKE